MTRDFNALIADSARLTGEFLEEQPWKIGQRYFNIDDYQDGLPVIVEIEVVDINIRCTISSVTGQISNKRFIYITKDNLGKESRIRYATPENSYASREEASHKLQQMLREKLQSTEAEIVEYTEEARMLRSAIEN
jgi:hypothetical protein